MNEESQLYYQIDRYLNREMTPSELLDFEKQIANDSNLAALVTEVKLVNDTVFYANLTDLKSTMKEDLAKTNQTSVKPLSKKHIISIFLLLVIAGGTYVFTTSENIKKPVSKPETLISDSLTTEETKNVAQTIKTDSIKNKREFNSEKLNTIKKAPITIQESKKQVPVIENKLDTSNLDSFNIFKEDDSTKLEKTKPIKPDTSNNTVIKPRVKCDKTFDIKKTASCKGKPTGTIILNVEKIQNYSFTIEGNSNHLNGKFYDVAAGEHLLIIEDKQCSYKKKITIDAKWCPLNSAYSFNPEFGETWDIILEKEDQGTFVIYNSAGKEIYKNNFVHGEASWEGIDQNGNFVDLGLYYAIIQYSDNRVEKVELTIVR